MENNRNFFITIALSVLILTLWQVFYMNPRIEAQREAARVEQARQEAQAPQPAQPAQPGTGQAVGPLIGPPVGVNRVENDYEENAYALAEGKRPAAAKG